LPHSHLQRISPASSSKAGGARLKFYLHNSSRAVDTFCCSHKDKEAKFGYFTATTVNLAKIFMVCADNLFLSATLKNE
jgi:hypothetical protein